MSPFFRHIKKTYIYTCYLLASPPHKFLPAMKERRKQANLSGINGVLRPGIVHRIDKDTTGALLVCKNDNAHRNLAEQLKEHSIRRRYRAIVAGVLQEDDGTIEGPIGRHPIDRKKMAVNYKNCLLYTSRCV